MQKLIKKIDPEVMFECLIYINAYYYPVFAPAEAIQVTAKYFSENYTPNIEYDAAVCFARLFGEIAKILIFYRWKEVRRKLVTAFALLMSVLSILTVVYTFRWQNPLWKLEKVLGVLTLMLMHTEIFFAILCFFPCFKRVDYM